MSTSNKAGKRKLKVSETSDAYALEYFYFCLSRPIYCSIQFGQFASMRMPFARVFPIKIGEGRKYTVEGVVRLPAIYQLAKCRVFKNV